MKKKNLIIIVQGLIITVLFYMVEKSESQLRESCKWAPFAIKQQIQSMGKEWTLDQQAWLSAYVLDDCGCDTPRFEPILTPPPNINSTSDQSNVDSQP